MIQLPAEFLSYLRSDAPKAGDLSGFPSYFQLWEEAELEPFNRQYGLTGRAPGFCGFGSDGHEEILAFDPEGRIQALPMADPSPAAATLVAESWPEFEACILGSIDPGNEGILGAGEEEYVALAWIPSAEAGRLFHALEQEGIRFRCRSSASKAGLDETVSALGGGAFGQQSELLVSVHRDELDRYHEVFRRLFLPEPPPARPDWRDRLRNPS
ncbi:MAG: hypothetical protein JSR82_08180 [Verrucomicrobia bacterium]|nr:hypothetical protein [Verrucomicrobiota bacterium]